MLRRQYLIIITLLIAFITNAQNTIIKGIVTDSITGERLPYVSLVFKGTTVGTATDDDGKFNFTTSTKATNLEVSYLGYDTKTVTVRTGRTNNYDIKLAPSGIALNEVVVKPKKEKYSKKENPAVEFVKNVIDRRESNAPRNHDYYSYDQYEKMIFALNEFQPKVRKDGKKGKFDFISEFIDTLEIGTTILPVSEKEKVQKIYYRKDPKKERTVVIGDKSSGIDEIFSRDGIAQLLNEVFKQVNIFQNDIPLFLMRFPSPLSTMGPNYYKYYLLDTLEMNNQKVVDLGFVPFNSETFAFTGHLYVTLDSTYFVEKAIFNVPKDLNLNFVHGMTIEQDFSRLPDGTRILDKDDIKVNFKLSDKEKGMYARRLNLFSNHSFEPIVGEEELVFNEAAPTIVNADARYQSNEFWAQNRPAEAQNRNKNSVQMLMQKLRSVPIYHVSELVIKTLVQGYIPTSQKEGKSKFEFGPMNTAISGNAIEGARLRVGGTTTKNFNKRFFMDGYLAYGTRDKKLKYDFLAEYSFIDKDKYRKAFPVHSIKFEYMYDINQLGQQYMYATKDNMFLAWKRQKDTRATYIRDGSVRYLREMYNGISYGATIRNLMEYSTEYAVFDKIMADGSINPIKRYDMTQLELNFRYAKDEKFYQTRNIRYPITFDAWIFTVSHKMALKDFLGSAYNYQRTDIGVQKRLWFSAFGYFDLITKAGKVWTKVPYPLLVLPNANLSYTIQPESYTNMNAMEFISDEYASWDLTYYINGNILNRIPLIKKLKWREVVTFRGMWGNLSDKNNPAYGGEGLYLFPQGSYTFGKEPYMEMGVGLENIFKFLRLDYVWRLNYKDHPGIQTKGVRFMMRMSF